MLGSAGLILYNRSALAAAVGLVSADDYLRQRAPDYQITQFLNNALAGQEPAGKALVFVRHLFYLRIPFVYGESQSSWAVDPDRFQTTESWRRMFREQGIRWVVRSPEYPGVIAAPLLELERNGELAPIARTEVSNFEGMRITGVRQTIPIVILEVKG